jgi:SAM-dependent methyltransferase
MAHEDRRDAGPEDTAGWGEDASALFVDFGRVFTPRRDEIAETIVDLIPADRDEAFAGADVAAGQGWLTEAILSRFPRARMLVLDGSPAMLAAAGELLAPFPGRFETRAFRLEDPGWTDDLPRGLRCVVSSLAIHHLDGPAKRALFGRIRERLAPGGALLIADLVEPTSAHGRRHMARAWDGEVRRQSLAATGDLRAHAGFLEERWNLYEHPDPEFDKPSPLPEQLAWLAEAGYVGVDAFWLRAGHAVYGGYAPGG